MNRFTQFLLRAICKKLIRQGFDHQNNLIAYYRIMQEALTNEFYEDSKKSLEQLSREALLKAHSQL